MGHASSVAVDKSQELINKKIDRVIAEDKKKDSKIIKLLLLGGSESGKSTFAKQMKILHMNGFSDSESDYFRHLIYHNILEAMVVFTEAMEQHHVQSKSKKFSDNVRLIKQIKSKNEWAVSTLHCFGPILEELWSDDTVKDCFKRRNEYNLPDNMPYFMGHIQRIFAADYKPDYDDILHSRITTTGIVEMDFDYNQLSFRLVDVGGQRSQRRKWIHCFDNAMAILFMVALSEYDLFLAEDPETKRMLDSLSLFESISNAEYFVKTPVVLFFNKKDIFQEKIATTPLSVCFPDYKGSNTYEEASEYVRHVFLKKKPHQKTVYCNFTNATDTRNIEFVFDATVDILFTKNMMKSGLT